MSAYLTAIQISLVDWAIRRSGENPDDEKFQVVRERVRDGKITLKQLQDFADDVSVPIGYLFLQAPPQEPFPIADFRAGTRSAPSLAARDVVNELLTRQEWLREYLIEQGAQKIDWLGAFTENDSPVEAAETIRERLGLEKDWRKGVRNAADAFRKLRERVEERGVFVFLFNTVPFQSKKRPLEPEEFRGVVLSDDYAPFIFINGSDVREANLFTLVHELAHLVLDQTGLVGEEYFAKDGRETFCDSVAAEFLLPFDEFESAWAELTGLEDNKERWKAIAKRFKVSEWAAARRAYALGKIGWREYSDACKFFAARWQARKNRPRPEKNTGGPDFYAVAKKRLGNFFVHVYSAANDGSLQFRDAYRYAGLKAGSFDRLIGKY